MSAIPQSRCTILIVAVAIATAVSMSFGQEAVESEPVTTESINAQIERINGNAELPLAEKERLIELYQQSLASIRAREEWESKTREFIAARETAPEQIAESERELLSRLSVPDPVDFAEVSLDDVRATLAEWERTQEMLRQELDVLEDEPGRRAERRRQIPELYRTARQRLEEISAAGTAAPVPGETAETAQARRLATQTKVEAIEAEIASHDAELNSYDARSRLLTLRLDVANRRITEAERWVAMLRDIANVKEQEEASRAAREARERLLEASNAPPEIRSRVRNLAEENSDLINERTGSNGRSGLAADLRSATETLDAISEQLESLEQNFEFSKARIKVALRTDLIGILLQNQLSQIPNEGDLKREVRSRAQDIATAQLREMELERRRREISDVEALVEEQLAELVPEAEGDEREAMAEALRQVYWANRRSLEALINDYDTYVTRLIEITTRQEELIETAASFRQFIRENILWVRSGTPINRETLRNTFPALLVLFDYRDLPGIPAGFLHDLRAYPMVYFLVALLCAGLIAGRRNFRARLVAIGMEASRPSQTRQLPTFLALMYTVLCGVAVPLPLILLSYRATTPYVAISASADALCTGIMWSSLGWAIFESIRMTLVPHGIALSHLKWGDEDCRVARSMLKVAMAIGLPLVAMISAFAKYPEAQYSQSAGRFAFLGLMLLILIQSHILFRPGRSVVLRIFRTFWDNPLLHRERFWYAVALFTPFVIGAAAGVGYYYSAYQLYWKIANTLVAFYVILIAGGMAVRWTLLERRRITMEQWKKKYSGADDAESQGPPMDMVRVDTQVSRMLRFVFLFSILGVVYAIWSDVLPALGVLDRIELGSTSQSVSVQETGADGQTVTSTDVQIVRITLRHAIIGLAILGITALAVRDLPGVLELAVLQRTRLGTGERYAITSIVSYVLAVVGIAMALNAVGLGWARLQWLVAALGLGLGFGLQEIFANFISGLILLFERPIRVGDIVTIGDVSGRVTRINIRATWIKSFNRRDLVVPNKEFVTGQLVNWTLSDTVLRIEIVVGIAYGSDVRLAKKLMLDCAKAHPMVTKDPPPEAYFNGFGDSALLLELRVFSPDVENYLTIMDEMHLAVDDAFRAAGIEISFPQRDLHIRSIDTVVPVSTPSVSKIEQRATEEGQPPV